MGDLLTPEEMREWAEDKATGRRTTDSGSDQPHQDTEREIATLRRCAALIERLGSEELRWMAKSLAMSMMTAGVSVNWTGEQLERLDQNASEAIRRILAAIRGEGADDE